MTSFLSPFIGQATFLLNFRELQKKIRFSQGDAEVAFGSFGAGQSQQTNVPDEADPNLPRIFFVKERKNISISQMMVQFAQSAESGFGKSLEEQFNSLAGQLLAFHRQALEFKPAQEYSHVALVLHVNYPSGASTAELNKFVHDKFVSFQFPVGELASVQLTVGYKVDDLFVNFGASVYEARHFDMTVKAGTAVQMPSLLHLEDMKVSARGVQFTIDINDRPLHLKNRKIGAVPPDELLNKAAQMLMEQLPKIVDGK